MAVFLTFHSCDWKGKIEITRHRTDKRRNPTRDALASRRIVHPPSSCVATAQFAPMIVRTLSLSLLLGAAAYAPHAAARAR